MNDRSAQSECLLIELEPEAERLLNRHLTLAEEWFPHEYIPYGRGREFTEEPWSPEQARIGKVAQAAFEVNLLTEDNLPTYHRLVYRTFAGGDGAWINWVKRWTAEEGRHAIALRDYLTVTRNIDPVALERARMRQVQLPYERDGSDVPRAIAFVAIQELVTRIAHLNTGLYSQKEEPRAAKLTERIAADENLHMVFYRDMVSTIAKIDPSWAVEAIVDEVLNFEMPGGMEDFRRKTALMAEVGIYDLRTHRDQVVLPLLRYWRVFELGGLSPEAERAREKVQRYIARLETMITRFEERRDAKADKLVRQL